MIQSLYYDNKEGVIYLRWRAMLTPRLVFWINGVRGKPKLTWIYDAMSVYKVNRDGFVCEHIIDNQVPSRTRLRPVFEDILFLGQVSTQSPAGAGIGGYPQWYSFLDERSLLYVGDRDSESMRGQTKGRHEVKR